VTADLKVNRYTLSNRLRGVYEVGPNVYTTAPFAAFIPPICIEAADKIDLLISECAALKIKIAKLEAI